MAMWNTWIYFSSLKLNSKKIGKLQGMFCVAKILSSFFDGQKQHNFVINISGSVMYFEKRILICFLSSPLSGKNVGWVLQHCITQKVQLGTLNRKCLQVIFVLCNSVILYISFPFFLFLNFSCVTKCLKLGTFHRIIHCKSKQI